MPQLDISTYLPQVFWAAILFALMFGMFIGFILPRMSNALQKRKTFVLGTEDKLKSLTKQNLELEASYQTHKDIAYKQLQFEIDSSLQAVRDNHDKKMAIFEKEITGEIHQLHTNFENQLTHFHENYKDVIAESVNIALKKVRNGR